jgi:hypothetical protein
VSAELYTELAATVLDLVAEFGRPITQRSADFVYDVVEGSRTGTATDTVFNGVVVNYFGRLLSDYRIVGNASTIKTDICVLCGGNTAVKDDSTLIFDNLEWSIFRIDDIAPGETVVYKKVWVRR